MIDTFNDLSAIGLGDVIKIILLLLIFTVAFAEILKKLPTLFGFETKAMIKERELNDRI